ncbi:MAG: 1,6-anhydro-N-acetylmuramyl-L-alanine amidase AmpD [Gammaproteobacteria bacterium]
MEVNASTGRVVSARWLPSPNCDKRPDGTTVDLLVLHNISLPAGQFGGPFIDALFTNTLDIDADPGFFDLGDVRVSAHVLIRRNGALVQYVSFNDRAWHAGPSSFGERTACNDFSIGIELEGEDNTAFRPAQYVQLARLYIALIATYPTLANQPVVGHSDIAPQRKTDPGPAFSWGVLGDEIKLLGGELPPRDSRSESWV